MANADVLLERTVQSKVGTAFRSDKSGSVATYDITGIPIPLVDSVIL